MKNFTLGKKVLCICAWGNSRSVCLAFLLKLRGHEAIACGMSNVSLPTLHVLSAWADSIVVTTAEAWHTELAAKYGEKLFFWDVGPDKYFRGYEPDLVAKFENFIKAMPQ